MTCSITDGHVGKIYSFKNMVRKNVLIFKSLLGLCIYCKLFIQCLNVREIGLCLSAKKTRAVIYSCMNNLPVKIFCISLKCELFDFMHLMSIAILIYLMLTSSRGKTKMSQHTFENILLGLVTFTVKDVISLLL